MTAHPRMAVHAADVRHARRAGGRPTGCDRTCPPRKCRCLRDRPGSPSPNSPTWMAANRSSSLRWQVSQRVGSKRVRLSVWQSAQANSRSTSNCRLVGGQAKAKQVVVDLALFNLRQVPLRAAVLGVAGAAVGCLLTCHAGWPRSLCGYPGSRCGSRDMRSFILWLLQGGCAAASAIGPQVGMRTVTPPRTAPVPLDQPREGLG